MTATEVGQLKGKCAYMSPEQCAGERVLSRAGYEQAAQEITPDVDQRISVALVRSQGASRRKRGAGKKPPYRLFP
jgi:hypothetical protein